MGRRGITRSRPIRSRSIIRLSPGSCHDCQQQNPPGTGGMVGNCGLCGVGLCATCRYKHRCQAEKLEASHA